MQLNSSLVKEVQEYASDLLSNKLPDQMTYHCFDHTRNVVESAKEIGAKSGLSEEELLVVEVAAWFHDLGYIKDKTNHEALSAEMAEQFLSERNVTDQKINEVKSVIMATQMPQQPSNLMESVICDADLSHLAREDFEEKSELLRQELEMMFGDEICTADWLEKNLKFVGGHQFFTDYAKEHLQSRADDNLRQIKKRVNKIKKEGQKVKKLESKVDDLKIKLEKAKDVIPTRGIETMFRLTSKNHLDLSAMADTKANIMISVNSIILSVLVSVLFRKLEQYPHLTIPAVIMSLVCLVTIVFAILATRPNVSRGTFTREDIQNKKTNLLFFGNFHKMKREDYHWGMKEMMKDGDYLYGSLINDIYYLGVVLGKKYRLLRISYTVFMFGFVIAVLSFMVAEVFFKLPWLGL